MMLNRRGRVINISSIIATTGFSGLAAYAASKAALEGFTRSLARELGRMNITVNAVAPGYMQTDMTLGLEGEKLRSEEHTSELQSLMRISYAVFCLKKNTTFYSSTEFVVDAVQLSSYD